MTARKTGRALAGFPGELPTNLEAAYAVQMRSVGLFGDQVIGWKVGGIAPQFAEQFGAKRLAGPIFERAVKTVANNETITMPAFVGGFAAMEAEYVVKLGELPDRDVNIDDIINLVDAVYIGAEIASSPMIMVNDLGPMSIISDFGNNNGMAIGPEIPKDTDFSQHAVSVVIDGDLAGEKPTGIGEAGPFGAVRFLINHLRAIGYPLPAGSYVSTGAVSGVHQTEIGSHSHIKFDGLGEFFIDLTPPNLIQALGEIYVSQDLSGDPPRIDGRHRQ
ncbi:2-keto-4-pentenoate hydratase [Litorimonas sp. RW-G-Af-16]|uniref:2-keto-4-pentenoate hydratase n=1 Tax=Litorimonas sp. RW-G-Af-16 TaxID=3241168 RepID=UPI003AAB0578